MFCEGFFTKWKSTRNIHARKGRAEALQNPQWKAQLPHCQQQQPLTRQSQGFKGEPRTAWMNDPQIPPPPKRQCRGKEKLLQPVPDGLDAVLTGGHQNCCQLKTPGSLTFTDPSLLFIATPAPCVLHHHPLLPCFLRRRDTRSTWDC